MVTIMAYKKSFCVFVYLFSRVVSNMPCPVCTIRDNGDRAGRMMPRGNGRTGLWCNSRNRDKRTCDFELDEYRYSP